MPLNKSDIDHERLITELRARAIDALTTHQNYPLARALAGALAELELVALVHESGRRAWDAHAVAVPLLRVPVRDDWAGYCKTCLGPARGGLEALDAGTPGDPNATVPGRMTYWHTNEDGSHIAFPPGHRVDPDD